MIKQAEYICDKCGMKAVYLPRVFFDEDYISGRRLCEPCTILFKEQYRLWCNDPKPLEEQLKQKRVRKYLFWN